MGHRTISYSQGVAIYIGAVLGSGILILPGYTADIAGPASILSWIILSLLSIPLAYSFAKLALKYENYGGIATIVNQAFGSIPSSIVGWFFFVWVATGENVVGFTGSGYMVTVFHLPHIYFYIIAELFLLLAFITNLFGMKTSGLFALILSAIVLILLILTISFSLPSVQSVHFHPFFSHGWNGVGKACALIFWAFFGWESITHLVPDFRHPHRDVMRSMWSSVFLIGIIYVLLSVVTVGNHMYGSVGMTAPLAVLMNKAIGVNASFATGLIASIVCLGTLNVYLASSSRLGYALAKEKKFPAWFSHLNSHGVPNRSAFFLFSTNSVIIAASYIFHISVDHLILVPTTLGIFVYIIAAFACVKLLWHDPFGRIAALIAAISCLAIVPFVSGYFIVPILVTILCLSYLWYRHKANKKEQLQG